MIKKFEEFLNEALDYKELNTVNDVKKIVKIALYFDKVPNGAKGTVGASLANDTGKDVRQHNLVQSELVRYVDWIKTSQYFDLISVQNNLDSIEFIIKGHKNTYKVDLRCVLIRRDLVSEKFSWYLIIDKIIKQ